VFRKHWPENHSSKDYFSIFCIMNVLDKVSVSFRSISPCGHGDKPKYNVLADVKAEIFLDTKIDKVGIIQAILVNRQEIPNNRFHETFDEHSGAMEWVGSTLLENRYGRPRLASLYEYDGPECDFMFITAFHVDETVNSEVAAAALHKFLRLFLHDPETTHQYGDLDRCRWRVSSAAYVLTHFNNENHQVQEDDKELAARREAEPFLRNGFFQDPALVQEDYDNQRLLVASYVHWNKPIVPKVHVPRAKFALSIPPKPSVKDRSILRAVQRLVVRDLYGVMPDFSDLMMGRSPYKPPGDPVSAQQLASLRTDLYRLRRVGGSVARSTAVHAACENNLPNVVKLLLEYEPTAVNARNASNLTPLMVAAKNASERCSINDINDTDVIDHLLSCGAHKAMTDSVGMTAYGYFRKTSKQMVGMTYLHGLGSIFSLENKLRPLAGPTSVDMAGGKENGIGIVDYAAEDDGFGRGIW
jgi:hypothetical protein